MKRATLAGVSTIEHGDKGVRRSFKLMKERCSTCPTLSAGESILQYDGWKKYAMQNHKELLIRKKAFQLALRSVLPFAWAAMWVYLLTAIMPRNGTNGYGMRPF
jgi:hypothetical protein